MERNYTEMLITLVELLDGGTYLDDCLEIVMAENNLSADEKEILRDCARTFVREQKEDEDDPYDPSGESWEDLFGPQWE